MTQLRQKLLSTVAGQLGRPHGLLGPLVARALNRGNARAIAAAVDAADVPRGGVAADIGFGGGLGLQLILDRVGAGGVVHGIELADDMLNRARSRFSREVGAGRLKLDHGSLTALPLDDASIDAVITLNTSTSSANWTPHAPNWPASYGPADARSSGSATRTSCVARHSRPMGSPCARLPKSLRPLSNRA
jgi:SAM-dependent methyltransferase